MTEYIKCNNCYAEFADEGSLSVITIEGGETIHACDTCNTDAYLMDIKE